MKLSMTLNYAGGFAESARQAVELEKVGLDVVWVAEAYSFDAPSFMGYLAAKTERVEIGSAILPIYSRTPTLIAMTAAGVDAISGGRCVLGLGASGPQVIEGFHGVPYDRPLDPHPRDHRDLPRRVGPRGARSPTTARRTTSPCPPVQGTGLGKPLKIINHPVRPRIPIWVAALGEKNVAMTAEVADGWLPDLLRPREGQGGLRALARRRHGQAGPVARHAADRRRRPASPSARRPRWRPSASSAAADGRPLHRRHGRQGQELLQHAGLPLRLREGGGRDPGPLPRRARRRRRRRWCPAELLEATSLCGPECYIKERVAALAEAGVTHLNVTPVGPDPVAMIEKLRSWV